MLYGWVVVGGLGVSELVSWGVLVYAFSAFVVPMSAELGWSPGQLNAAYALGIGVSGLVAVPVGRWLTHHGAPMLMTAGSAVTVGVLLAWSQASSLPVFFLVCVGAGLAMAATLYEPAFVLTTRWFNDTTGRAGARARAVLVVTVFGGLASTVFIPLSGALITSLGWREALLVLAVIAAAVGLPIHALVLRDHPQPAHSTGAGTAGTARTERAEGAEGAPPAAAVSARQASFVWLAVSLATSTAAKTGVSVVLVAYLVARGYPLERAALIAGAVGAAQVGGRLLVTALHARVPEHRTHAAIFTAQALACLLPLTTTGTGAGADVSVWAFVIVFGLGFGLPELLRGTLVVDLYGTADYPRLNGVLSTWVVTARALGPLLAGAAATLTQSYTSVLAAAAALCLLSALTLLAAHRAHRAHRPTSRSRSEP